MGGTGSQDENSTPSDIETVDKEVAAAKTEIATVDKDLSQIVSDAYHNWEERTNIDPDAPSTEGEREQMEQELRDSMPNPERYPENNDGDPLPDKEPAPGSDSPSEGGSENEREGDAGSDGDGGGDRDGGDRDGGDGDRGGGG